MPLDNPHRVPFSDVELLMDARDRIGIKSDWVQGRYQDGNRHCVVAALSIVCGSPSFNIANQTERRLARQLVVHLSSRLPFWTRLRFFTARQRLMWFNDDPRTTHSDVMGLFDRAISHQTARLRSYIAV